MDRPISKNNGSGKWMKWALGMMAMAISAYFGFQFIASAFGPSLKREDIMAGTVDQGPVSAVIETTGVLTPEHERVLTAPGETRILRVVRKPGTLVAKGDPILELDTTALELERDSLMQQVGVKENTQRQTILQFERDAKQKQAELELVELDLKFYEAQYRQQAQLFEKGLSSKDALQQAELQMEKTRVEKRQLLEAVEDAKSSHRIALEGYKLELDLLQKSLGSAEKLLRRATTNAPADGVLTWVVEAEGATVRSGEPLARIADLTNFKVTANISDYYADRIQNHQAAKVRVGEEELDGQVLRLLPEVTNGTMAFEVGFDNREGLPLRPNQRVTVFLVTSKRMDVLRIRRAAAFSSPGQMPAFVLRGNNAVRTMVEIGITGSNYTEIVAGLKKGDQVILNDLSAMKDHPVIPVK